MAATKKKVSEEKQLQENPVPEVMGDIAAETAPPSTWSKVKRFFNTVAILLLLFCLIGGGFFLGVYLQVFDLNTMNKKLALYEYPIIGEYFVKPADDEIEKTQEEVPAESVQEQAEIPVVPTPIVSQEKTKGVSTEQVKTQPGKSKSIVLSKEEIDKQVKLQQAAEKKRVAKLARLYEQMKPEDAVNVLTELNNDMIIAILGRMDEAQVSKLLVKFDAGRSAELTRLLYSGKPPVEQIR